MAKINTFDRSLKVLARNHAELFLRLVLPNAHIQLVGQPENVVKRLSPVNMSSNLVKR